ncbi:unnamed protein product [Bemisia tabaci]|uniref:Salivary secreted peptide n=1 Tax=Bemisia tabaci TaxID=7038 RepID=A0A9P0F9L0_BEMTA|nr:unnamed protein product [Bemisia tabaci]
MTTKLAVALALTFVAVVQSDVTKHEDDQGKNHSLILGQRRFGDRVIHIEIVKQNPRFTPLWSITRFIKFPSNGEKNDKTINFLQVVDMTAEGHGGSSSLIDGGIGAKHVILRLTAERGHGLDSVVYIYGYDN